MLKLAGVSTGIFEVVTDAETPFELRARDAPPVAKVVSLNREGASLVTLGAAADGRLSYLTLVSAAGPLGRGADLSALPVVAGAPRLDLDALGFGGDAYQTLSRSAPIALAETSDGFDLRLADVEPDRGLDAGAALFLLSGDNLAGVVVRGLSAAERERASAALRWTAATV